MTHSKWILSIGLSILTMAICLATCNTGLDHFYYPNPNTTTNEQTNNPIVIYVNGGGEPTTTSTTSTGTTDTSTSGTTTTTTTYTYIPNEADYQPPQLNIESTMSGDTVGPDFTLSGSVLDNIAVAEVLVQLDNGAWEDATVTDTAWEYAFTGLNSGYHFITVRVKDTSNNTETKGVFVVVDNAAPTVLITSPEEGGFFGSSLTITGTSEDGDGGGVDYIEVQMDNDGTWLLADGAPNWSFNWTDAGTASIGAHTVDVRAVDVFGNESSIQTLNLTKSNWDQIGNALNVDGTMSYDATRPDLAIYNGVTYVTFHEHDGSKNKVWVRKWNGVASSWETMGSFLNISGSQDAQYPRIVITDDGNIYVAFQEFDGADSRWHVYVKTWNSGTTSWDLTPGGEFTGYEAGKHDYAPCITTQNGKVIIAYRADYHSAYRYRTNLHQFDGSTWTSAGIIDPSNYYGNFSHDLSCTDTACYLAYRYRRYYNSADNYNRIYVRKSTDLSNWDVVDTWMGNNDVDANSPNAPSIVAVNDELLYLAFHQTDGTYTQIETYKWTQASGVWTSIGSANDEVNHHAYRPSLAIQPTAPGNIPYITFHEDLGSGQYHVFLKKFDDPNWVNVTVDTLNPTPGYSSLYPRLVFDMADPYITFHEESGSNPSKVYLKYLDL